MTIATPWYSTRFCMYFCCTSPVDILAIGHGDDPAHEDVGGRAHGDDEGDDEERVHAALI